MPPPRRKKWTEAEERTLIDKYSEMVSDGSLPKMKTREKKYKPIAVHVNSIHHVLDPIGYPWEWSWKDVSNKVQNMRHQYSLVKQKIKRDGNGEEFDWAEGLTFWSNFLRYKEVFGDIGGGDSAGVGFEQSIVPFGGEGDYSGEMGLEFDYDGGEGEENYDKNEENNNGYVYGDIEPIRSETRKKRKVANSQKAWGFFAGQLAQLREMEARFERREEERERRERKRAENEENERVQREKAMEKSRENRIEEWRKMENERERRREEETGHQRAWEERRNRKRAEWRTNIDEMLAHHRAEMGQIQARILQEQQSLTGQLLGLLSGQPGGFADHTNGGNHYLSQLMQNLQHVGGMVDGDARVEEDTQDDQFIVDG